MENKPKVSLLILSAGHYWHSKKALESWGLVMKESKTIFIEDSRVVPHVEDIEVEIIATEFPNDIRINELYKRVDAKIIETENKNPYNELLKNSTGDYICFINPLQALPKGWLSEILSSNQLVDKAGITYITSDVKSKVAISLLDENLEFVTMLCEDNNRVDGTVLFSRKMVELIGGFDDYLYGMEMNQYAHRLICMGYQNFCLPDVFGIDLCNENKYGSLLRKKGYENFDLSIEKMTQTRNWRIEI